MPKSVKVKIDRPLLVIKRKKTRRGIIRQINSEIWVIKSF